MDDLPLCDLRANSSIYELCLLVYSSDIWWWYDSSNNQSFLSCLSTYIIPPIVPSGHMSSQLPLGPLLTYNKAKHLELSILTISILLSHLPHGPMHVKLSPCYSTKTVLIKVISDLRKTKSNDSLPPWKTTLPCFLPILISWCFSSLTGHSQVSCVGWYLNTGAPQALLYLHSFPRWSLPVLKL